jgi:ribosomal protein S18 acetylase RimI-like enzyme
VFLERASPVNQAANVDPADTSQLDSIERFFSEREVGARFPLPDPSPHAEALAARGYQPSNELAAFSAKLAGPPRPPDSPPIRILERLEYARYGRLAAAAFGGGRVVPSDVRIFGGYALMQEAEFLAVDVDGEPAAVARVICLDGIAELGGAAVAAAYRGRGLQRALVAARLALAAERGCAVAFADAEPGSLSARNLAQAGMREVGRLRYWRCPA